MSQAAEVKARARALREQKAVLQARLEQAAWDCLGYCELDIRDGVLVGLTPGEIPPPPPREPTDTDILNALLGVEV